MSELTSVIEWNRVEDGPPDEENPVLMAVHYAPGQFDGIYHEVVPGFLSKGGLWRYMDRFLVSEKDRVTHWAAMPKF